MDPSDTKTNVGCKAILLGKLSCAIIYSVLAQIIVLFAFLFIINFDVFQPLEWLKSFFRTIVSVSTWLYILPFACIIFAQCVICAKDYIVKPTYNASRFRKFLSYFSTHNFVLLVSYMIIGSLNVWLYLSLSRGKYESLYSSCKQNQYCLVEEYLFMILSGAWVGIYYFLIYCASEKHIQFPIIQQYKLVRFKANFLSVLEESRRLSIWPTVSYFFIYFLWGASLCQKVSNVFGIQYQSAGVSLACYIYVWLFMILYFFCMKLMGLFFNLFLTEAVEFPLNKLDEMSLSLNEGIGYSELPIVQHLACLDLYLLSIWSPARRGIYFTLSQPGGHPHNWNSLVENSLKVLTQFMKTLNECVTLILEPPKSEQPPEEGPIVTEMPAQTTAFSRNVQNPYLMHQKYENMRNMSLISNDPVDLIEVTYEPPKFTLRDIEMFKRLKEKLNSVIERIKATLRFNYFFGEVSEVNVHICLRSGQPIVWLTQALSHLVVASFTEDRYGVAQKDLHIIITTLIELKQCMDKLNKLPTLSRRSPVFQERSLKMKLNINAAIKRSLYNVCLRFEQHLKDLPLSKEVRQQLQYYKL